MQFPTIKILSPTLELLGIVENYTSLRFKRSWQSYGDFEIHIENEPAAKHLISRNLIMLDNDVNRVGIIQFKKGEGREKVIKGYHLNCITTQRIVLPYEGEANGGYFCVPKVIKGQNVGSASPETIVKTFVSEQFSGPYRAINMDMLPDLKRGGRWTRWLSRYEQLSDVLQDICEYTDIGYRVFPNISTQRLNFDALIGVNRAASQSENSTVIFSREFDSLEDISYVEDVSAEKNIAYVGGVGEDFNRTVINVTNNLTPPSGLNRTEVFIDCGTLEVAETEENISLLDEGKHKLQEHARTETLTGTVSKDGPFQYKRDWDLGDLVTVCDKEMDVQQDKRITEVEEVYEPTSTSIKVTLGTPPKHLNRIIKSYQSTVK